MLPEEKARVKIDKQLRSAGWDIVARNEYLPNSTSAVKENVSMKKVLKKRKNLYKTVSERAGIGKNEWRQFDG